MRIRDPGWGKFGSVIRDGKKSDPGYGIRINIPDPQHWKELNLEFALFPPSSPFPSDVYKNFDFE